MQKSHNVLQKKEVQEWRRKSSRPGCAEESFADITVQTDALTGTPIKKTATEDSIATGTDIITTRQKDRAAFHSKDKTAR